MRPAASVPYAPCCLCALCLGAPLSVMNAQAHAHARSRVCTLSLSFCLVVYQSVVLPVCLSASSFPLLSHAQRCTRRTCTLSGPVWHMGKQ